MASGYLRPNRVRSSPATAPAASAPKTSSSPTSPGTELAADVRSKRQRKRVAPRRARLPDSIAGLVLLEVFLESTTKLWSPQLGDRLRLDLADSLTRQAEDARDL